MVPTQKRQSETIDKRSVRRHPAQPAHRPAVPAAAARSHREAPCHARAGRQPLPALHTPGQVREAGARAGCPCAARKSVARAGQVLRAQLGPPTSPGISAARALMLLLERGTPRDAETWAEHLLEKIARFDFAIAGRKFRSTAVHRRRLAAQRRQQARCHHRRCAGCRAPGPRAGGNQVCSVVRADADARVQSYDAVWVQAHPRGTGGEPLPPGAAAHRQPRRRWRAACSTC